MKVKLLKRARREFNRRYKVSVIVNDRIGYRGNCCQVWKQGVFRHTKRVFLSNKKEGDLRHL